MTFFMSCVKESLPECPYQYGVQLFVLDKNYSNISGSLGESKPENLPFNQYITDIYYTLESLDMKNNIISPRYFEVKGDQKEITLTIDSVPDGNYVLTVWGNVNYKKNTLFDPEMLHDNDEKADTYYVSDTLAIVSGIKKDIRLGMYRTKGLLDITINNLPESVVKVWERVSSVYQYMDKQSRGYTGMSDVEKNFLKSDQLMNKLDTYLAPTVEDRMSKLDIKLFTALSGEPMLTLPTMDIEIERNQVSSLLLNYLEEEGRLEIWSYINEEWTLIHMLEIDDPLEEQ